MIKRIFPWFCRHRLIWGGEEGDCARELGRFCRKCGWHPRWKRVLPGKIVENYRYPVWYHDLEDWTEEEWLLARKLAVKHQTWGSDEAKKAFSA